MAFTGASNLTAPLHPISKPFPSKPRIFAVHASDPTNKSSSSQTTTFKSLTWTPTSWKSRTAHQLPVYPDPEDLNSVLKTLETFPPIVFAGEARNLEERLASAAVGKAFLLQGGDCAESFKEFNGTNIRDTFRVLLQMGIVLTFGAQMPVIKVAHAIFWSICEACKVWIKWYLSIDRKGNVRWCMVSTRNYISKSGAKLKSPLVTEHRTDKEKNMSNEGFKDSTAAEATAATTRGWQEQITALSESLKTFMKAHSSSHHSSTSKPGENFYGERKNQEDYGST